MIVVDASVVLDFLLGPHSPAGDRLSDHLEGGDVVCAPHLVDTEVGQGLRRLAMRREIDLTEASDMLGLLATLPLERYPHRRLVPRAFELRDNVSVYDGVYLALAELLDIPLLTGDAALSDVPGCGANVDVVATTAA
ncbi:MAG: type II toxin-antitoxin system VapC family toxin [Acidimicrobiia bacterium]